MTSVSEIAVQTNFCPLQQVCLARQLRLPWFYFDPLGTFTPLGGLLRLISFPTTISSHNHYYRSQVLSARQLSFAIFLRSFTWIGKFPLLICFAPFDPCFALGNFFTRILVIFVGRNTSVVTTTHTATRNSDTPPASPRELPTSHTSACNDWYTYYTSHNAPLAPLAVLPINQHYKNLHI